MHNHCLVALVSVLVWVEGMSLRTARKDQIGDAYVLCMCVQGKHRSMYFARVLCAVLELLLKALKVKAEVCFHWLACQRIMASVSNDDSRYNRQTGPICREIL